MTLKDIAYLAGRTDALQKFAAPVGGLVPPAMPKAATPPSSIVPQASPAPVGGGSALGVPTAPPGMPAAAGTAATPGMALQGSPVLGTGEKPVNNSAAVAGQTAMQGAQKSVTTHGGGK